MYEVVSDDTNHPGAQPLISRWVTVNHISTKLQCRGLLECCQGTDGKLPERSRNKWETPRELQEKKGKLPELQEQMGNFQSSRNKWETSRALQKQRGSFSLHADLKAKIINFNLYLGPLVRSVTHNILEYMYMYICLLDISVPGISLLTYMYTPQVYVSTPPSYQIEEHPLF